MSAAKLRTGQEAAVIDVGSNSVRLVIYRIDGRAMTPILNEKVMAGLGRDLAQSGRLSPDGVDVALRALRRFTTLTEAQGVKDVFPVATAAVREAEDGGEFAARVLRETGLKLRILDGAGLILGAPGLVARCRRHPLARALRLDKLHLAALAGTLQDHLLSGPVPTLTLLTEDAAVVRTRAERLRERVGAGAVAADRAAVGSGASPTSGPDTWVLRLEVAACERLARRLRTGAPPVVPRIARGAVLIDLRTVGDDQVDALAAAVRTALADG